MDFEGFIRDIKENEWKVFGTEVYENGQLKHAWGDTCENTHYIYSATKTILSIAAGMVIDEGKFDIHRPVLSYMPASKIALLPKEQQETFRKITIRRLLTMSVGDLPFRAEGNSYLDFSLNCKISEPETLQFNYSNICAYMVGVALTEALGRDLGTYIEERLLAPLGIDNYSIERCPEGYFYGASGMKLTVNELSRVGLLLYDRGMYEGKRIVSEQYVNEATSVQMMNREGGYGYFIWKYRDGFSINGRLKQKCYVLPKEGLVITYLSEIEDPSRVLCDSMEKHILGI